MKPIAEILKGVDWEEIELNIRHGDPCFFCDDNGLCLRAETWEGHLHDHPFRSLHGLVEMVIVEAVAERDARIAELSRLLERIERERSVHSDVWSRDITTEIRKALGKGE